MTASISNFNRYSFPRVSAPLPEGERGIASLRWGATALRFRTNPNEFNWNYEISKRIDSTYGGRVVQLLGTKIGDFSIKADCGAGRWEYMNQVSNFVRDIMINQRNGTPATFEYTTRGWRLNVYVVSMPFADSVEEVAREFEIQMKVQEDVSGVMSRNSLSAELSRLKDGVAFQRTKYNDPTQDQSVSDQEQGLGAELMSQLANAANNISGGIQNYVTNNPLAAGSPGATPAPSNNSSGLPGIK